MEARDALLRHYLEWAERVVAGVCRRRGMPLAELHGAAVDGLLRAIPRYDCARGKRFVDFASQHVRGATLDMARKNDPRQVSHGRRPDYVVFPGVGPMFDDMRATRRVPDEVGERTRELAASVLAAVGTPCRRELFVRCAMGGESARDVGPQLNMSPHAAGLELRAAREEAAQAAVEAGLVSRDEAVRLLMLPGQARGARYRPTMMAEELEEAMVSELLSRREPAREQGLPTHPLVGACPKCGAAVVGPRAPRGPVTVDCPECGERAEVT
jgi:hypothetical protein